MKAYFYLMIYIYGHKNASSKYKIVSPRSSMF